MNVHTDVKTDIHSIHHDYSPHAPASAHPPSAPSLGAGGPLRHVRHPRHHEQLPHELHIRQRLASQGADRPCVSAYGP